MDKSVNSGDNAYKSAVRHKFKNLDFDSIADLIFLGKDYPRIILGLLISKRNFLRFGIIRLDFDFDNVADINDFGRMLNSAPGKIGYMNKSVHAADIDKCAECGKRLNGSRISLSDFDIVPDFFLSGFFFFFENGFDGSDDTASSAVFLYFNNAKFDIRSFKRSKILGSAKRRKRRGNKNSDLIDKDNKSAFYYLNNFSGNDLAALFEFGYALASFFRVKF